MASAAEENNPWKMQRAKACPKIIGSHYWLIILVISQSCIDEMTIDKNFSCYIIIKVYILSPFKKKTFKFK